MNGICNEHKITGNDNYNNISYFIDLFILLYTRLQCHKRIYINLKLCYNIKSTIILYNGIYVPTCIVYFGIQSLYTTIVLTCSAAFSGSWIVHALNS